MLKWDDDLGTNWNGGEMIRIWNLFFKTLNLMT